jgi:lysophospholipase L1-like esterase
MDRREFIGASAAAVGAALAGAATAVEVEPAIEGDTAWYDVRKWGVEGKGWAETERYFDRLPPKAHGVVRQPVWDLSRQSAGMMARFQTDAKNLRVRYTLLSSNLALPHMPATGVSGVDLYAQDTDGQFRWLAVSFPTAKAVEAQLVPEVDPSTEQRGRSYHLYLPLYNGTESLEVGVPKAAAFRAQPPRTSKPILFYGTSIMQGACASRPGIALTAILGRRLKMPVVNLGFSGNGQMEPEVGKLLAELDPAVYVIDCLPNMSPELVAQRAAPLAQQLRAARPETPILLVEDRTFTNAPFRQSARIAHHERRQALRKAFDELKRAGVGDLHYLPGDDLVGDDGEGATDGSHPNDLGMMRYADAYEPALRKLLRPVGK